MGLDMYLTGRKYFWSNYEERADERKEDGYKVRTLDIDLGYWRKHPNLHGYIVQEFAKGKDDCEEIELSADDLRNLIGAVKAKRLPKTEGFFFGASDGSDEERDEDLTALNKALLWLANDPDPFESAAAVNQRVSRSVHYRASW